MLSETEFATALSLLMLVLAYACAWVASTLPEIRDGKVIRCPENPRDELFWWIPRRLRALYNPGY